MSFPRPTRSIVNGSLFVSLLLLATGCRENKFVPNELAAAGYLQRADPEEVSPLARRASEITGELFGTPDAPKWPEGVEQILDWSEVERSAGPVGRAHDRVERGLYRKHCVQCHGLTGDGAGPAASLLAPYARDFRRGTFKFKSTPIGSKPTRADLVKIIEAGIPGTAMPAFAPLRNREEFASDIESMVEYVIYLSIRGEVERRLLRTAANEEIDLAETDLTAADGVEAAKRIVAAWKQAPEEVPEEITVPELTGEELAESITRGHALFKSDKTACYKCHGPDGKGDGVSQDYDEWTKDWTIRVGLDPANKSEWRTMKPFGALKPVLNRSRNFHLGALRGGSSVADIARRIQVGIDGTPMPSAAIAPHSPNGITEEEFRDLVRYVVSLIGQNVSVPKSHPEASARDNAGNQASHARPRSAPFVPQGRATWGQDSWQGGRSLATHSLANASGYDGGTLRVLPLSTDVPEPRADRASERSEELQ